MARRGMAHRGMVRQPEGADLMGQHPDRLDTPDGRGAPLPPPPLDGLNRPTGLTPNGLTRPAGR
jgi:hypothetical protein